MIIMQIRWLYRLTYVYLLLPFILFVLGWLRLFIAIPVATLMVWILWRLLNRNEGSETDSSSLRITIYSLLITGFWIFLSGVGGYAFQNWDHHWRNAVFRDLITYDWPVFYSQPERGPIKMLVYYVGYWLPAALAGKLLGWNFANSILFLWTWFGVLLVALHLSLRLNISSWKAALLLMAFSGMDALGALFFASEYPTLWPPVQHLEIWSSDLQYSSFTTQLFWVFNQAVPAWLCIVFFVILSDRRERRISGTMGETLRSRRTLPQSDTLGRLIFLWALCFFFAPLASIGLLPYLLIEWFKQARTNPKSALKNVRLDLILAGAVIVVVSYLFFSSNTAAQERGFQSLAFKDVIIFFLLEGGILWLLLAPRLWRDPRWAVTGILLFVMSFVQVGSGRDFVMRASIAPLFYLMLWTSEVLTTKRRTGLVEVAGGLEDTKNKSFVPSWLHDFVSNHYESPQWLRIALLVCLCIGALTPIYEINRSMYRTFEYYFVLDEDQRSSPPTEPTTHLEQGGAPEAEHPGSLVADDIQTFTFMDDKLSQNFIANVRQSLYYRYVAPH